MSVRTLRRLAAAPLALVVALLLAVFAVTSAGVALAGGHHDHDGDQSVPRTENDITNLTHVKDRVKLYYGDFVDATQAPGFTHQASPTSNYAREVARVERRAAAYLRDPGDNGHHGHGSDHRRHASSGAPAIVLDVDDTSVLTYEYDANNDFGFIPSINAQYVTHGFPAVFGMPALVNWAHSHGYAVFFITGRPDAQHADTVANLTGRELDGQSYPFVATGSVSPQGDSLFTKPANPATIPTVNCNSDGIPACSTIEYKSGARAFIETKGFHIVANFGDQFSDLKGGFSDATFKIPNPMYFLP